MMFGKANLYGGRSSMPATIGTSGRVRANEAPDQNGRHAVLVQGVLGFVEQRFVLLQERPAVQGPLKARPTK